MAARRLILLDLFYRIFEPCEGPAGALGYRWIFIQGKFFKQRQECWVSAISHGDDRVSPETRTFRPADGRTPKSFAKFLGVHLCEPIQGRIHKTGAG